MQIAMQVTQSPCYHHRLREIYIVCAEASPILPVLAVFWKAIDRLSTEWNETIRSPMFLVGT
jgi:hypothetical protein